MKEVQNRLDLTRRLPPRQPLATTRKIDRRLRVSGDTSQFLQKRCCPNWAPQLAPAFHSSLSTLLQLHFSRLSWKSNSTTLRESFRRTAGWQHQLEARWSTRNLEVRTKLAQPRIAPSVSPPIVAFFVISFPTDLPYLDRHQRLAFFHMWSQNSWTSFTEHVIARLTVCTPDTSSFLGKLVVSRTNGTPMVHSNYLDTSILAGKHSNRYPRRHLACFPSPLTTFPGSSFKTRPRSSSSTRLDLQPPRSCSTWTRRRKQTIF